MDILESLFHFACVTHVYDRALCDLVNRKSFQLPDVEFSEGSLHNA
jgi:hypothetical protein